MSIYYPEPGVPCANQWFWALFADDDVSSALLNAKGDVKMRTIVG
jgi:hypothetical protein